jgi:hypothetical protein
MDDKVVRSTVTEVIGLALKLPRMGYIIIRGGRESMKAHPGGGKPSFPIRFQSRGLGSILAFLSRIYLLIR